MARGYIQQGVYGIPSAPNVLAPTSYSLQNLSGNVIPAFGCHPDAIPRNPSSLDDEFQGSYLNQKWVPLNFGAATATITNSSCTIHPPAGTGTNLRMLVQPLHASPWTITAKVAFNGQWVQFCQTGIFVRNSGSGKILSLCIECSTLNRLDVNLVRFASPTTGAVGVTAFGGCPPTMYLRMICDGTNIQTYWSFDGIGYNPSTIEALATHIGSVDSFGIYADSVNATFSVYGGFDWIRMVPRTTLSF